MEELQVIETTSGRQFKPWATKDDLQDPASVTAITSEIASGKAAIAAAINAKGGEAYATESFTELAQDIQDTPTSGILSTGVVQSEPFGFLDYVYKLGAYPFTEIDDDSVTVISRPNAFDNQTRLLKVKMTALTTISGGYVFQYCSALQQVNLPNLATISGGYVFQYCSSLQYVNLPNLATISGVYVFNSCSFLQEVNLPNLATISGTFVFSSCTALQEVNMPNLVSISSNNFYNCHNMRNIVLGKPIYLDNNWLGGSNRPNLRNITIGEDTNINLPFQLWTATNVIAEGQSGIDELNSNLQTNLISKLYQGGGKILRLGAALYDVTTQETRDMVTAKGWALQRG